MKLTAKTTPYSSTVGGGLTLVDATGRAHFMVMICGITDGITKDENATIAAALADGISGGIEISERL